MLQTAINSGVLDQVTGEFLKSFQNNYGNIETLAKGLFYYLAAIQIAISAVWMFFKGDPIEAAVKTIQLFFTISVFYTLVLFGGQWMPQIINGFISIGSNASGIHSLTPSSVLDQGISIGFSIMDNFSHWGWLTHPVGSILAATILLFIIIVYAFLAAEVAIILIKSYTLVTLSGLMFTFGATEPLRPMAMNYFKAVIGIGLHLLTLYMLMGVGVTIGHDWADLLGKAAAHHELKPFLIVTAAVIFFYLIVRNIPAFIAGLSGVGGFKNYGDAAIGTALTASGVGARGMMSATRLGGSGAQSFGQGAKGAYQMGHSFANQMKTGTSISSAMGHAAKQMGRSMGSAVKDSVMRTNQHMSFGQKVNAKMAARMSQEAHSATKASSPGSQFKPNKVDKQ